MNNTPRVEWNEEQIGTKAHSGKASIDGISMWFLPSGGGWTAHIVWVGTVDNHETLCSPGSSFCLSPAEAKADCEYYFSREWKARAWDEMQKATPKPPHGASTGFQLDWQEFLKNYTNKSGDSP